ncbi:hypothetical protein G3O06_03445 [Burkholderia sp. Ac-20345]|uniref:hypothetical protein n=1 Tax=Burkholderia sp. Ac-20345 TaxID=2703891 RepID=UPI00197C6EEE|nr:hypothetical protein [Burkholderia sp. Ac-20345]MBN3776620.1 hypothetical protein [Burkholderia sp. Ac-20345]
MKKTLVTIAVLLTAAVANAGSNTPPVVDINWSKEGQILVRGTHRFVAPTGALIPFAATTQQQFPYSTCTLDGNTPRYQAKQLPIGRALFLKPQRTSRGTIHLEVQAEDTEVRTVNSADHGPCTSMSPVTGGLPLTTLSVELPEQGAITVSFPDGHYALTLTVERDSK